MTRAQKTLIVLTSHGRLGDSGRPTGFWWEELAEPYRVFAEAGMDIDLASIRGGEPPADPASLAKEGARVASVDSFRADPAAMAKLRATHPLAEVEARPYDIVLLAGGHGAMWDMPDDSALARLLEQISAQGGVVAAVCHGPAGLVGARAPDGSALVAGRRIAAFTDAEEAAQGLSAVVPFLLETRLRDLGAYFEPGPAFETKAVRDGRLVTGQNPMSSRAVAELALEAARDPVGR